MKKYIKNAIIKNTSEIIINKNGLNIYNPTEEMILNDGWIEYIEPEQTIEHYRYNKIIEIINYDSSSSVNEFYIQDKPIWLDKNTRVGLKLRFESELAMGKTETTLWYNNTQFSLTLENAMQILYTLECYASACYDNTQKHLTEVKKLTNIEDIKNYNHTIDYPEKLKFFNI